MRSTTVRGLMRSPASPTRGASVFRIEVLTSSTWDRDWVHPDVEHLLQSQDASQDHPAGVKDGRCLLGGHGCSSCVGGPPPSMKAVPDLRERTRWATRDRTTPIRSQNWLAAHESQGEATLARLNPHPTVGLNVVTGAAREQGMIEVVRARVQFDSDHVTWDLPHRL